MGSGWSLGPRRLCGARANSDGAGWKGVGGLGWDHGQDARETQGRAALATSPPPRVTGNAAAGRPASTLLRLPAGLSAAVVFGDVEVGELAVEFVNSGSSWGSTVT
jgi:hypothetical protein